MASRPTRERRFSNATVPARLGNVERRREERYSGWLPVRIDGTEASLGVSHNASRSGMMLVARVQYAAESQVDLVIQLAEGKTLNAKGRVVRSGPNTDDPDGLWPYSLAVEFEQPLEILEAHIKPTGA